jgi:hypothetical protein
MKALDEGSKGASFHGGLYEALASVVLWCSCLLGGGCTIGEGRTPSREVLHLSNCWLECLVGEVAHKVRFVRKGFLYKATRSNSARFE